MKPQEKKILFKLLLLEKTDDELTIIEHVYKKKIYDMFLARKTEGFYSVKKNKNIFFLKMNENVEYFFKLSYEQCK
jgi:hypothetical protein